jgi:hypothetical protein
VRDGLWRRDAEDAGCTWEGVYLCETWFYRRVELCGQENFKGVVCHSSGFTSGEDYAGKKAVVIGSCNSGGILRSPARTLLADAPSLGAGHDVALDFFNHGVDVTM